jgi:hypothetical protein
MPTKEYQLSKEAHEKLKAYIEEKILRREPGKPIKALIKQVGGINLAASTWEAMVYEWVFDCRNGAKMGELKRDPLTKGLILNNKGKPILEPLRDEDGNMLWAGWTLHELCQVRAKARGLR